MPTDQAVERGIRMTASTVASAAAMMIAVFAIVASLRTLDIKPFGVGLAAAVFIYATPIRGLLPAAMRLLGDWNWYLPRWFDMDAEPDCRPKLAEDVPRHRRSA
jgi:RND superfamily putative drug exporter